ncbi:Undecaprenyl diphosphate synthase [Cryphonectria parasitica EP155]|uniref:Alkyl transferase n=1 Tax=Cryphonectria parasitica (strain ATCC 38755 / EP155) TaxID=660469 RepID=A0A9P4Y4F3_CRYP1|nr:Undecaprenyl diphosphate synthase [Cryphonectria parasitica EP155]KAF3766358.1 Undecaprenyl diphosphate synthase [Cryphonectria parasitica EP155]
MSDLYLSHLQNWLLSSPPAEWILKQTHELLIGALRQGPIPQHIAFVMDGNRRYARGHKIETLEGHHLGFEAMARVLEVCYKCGVKAVTVYAFSLENFNRPKAEVDGLMLLAKTKLAQLVQHGELMERYDARIKICGKQELIPDDVMEIMNKAVEATSKNTGPVLNLCFPYGSREEMTQAVRATINEYMAPPPPKASPFSQTRITKSIKSRSLGQSDLPSIDETPSLPPSPALDGVDGSDSSSATLNQSDSPSTRGLSHMTRLPDPETITTEMLTNHMYTAGDPPLDIFVRTSGVERLSDFMLWQCHQDTQFFFLKCMWPELDLWRFLPVLIEWQWRQKQKDMEEKPRQGNKQR